MDMLQLLLRHGAEIEAGDHTNWTVLFFACQSGALKTIQLLLDLGANLHAHTTPQVTPLMVAVKTDDPVIVQYLIDQGSDVHAAEEDGFRALHYCAQNSYPKSAKTLLQNGADVNARDKVRSPQISFLKGCLEWKDSITRRSIQVRHRDASASVGFWSKCPCHRQSRLHSHDRCHRSPQL